MIPLLSVVVPIYNVEPYITECLKSLAAQTLDDIEVILVNDGSGDGSRRVAADFVARDGRFALIDQRDNLGPGPARNVGIRQARGTYLAFADSDDVVPPEAYERLVGTLAETGSDLACGAVARLVDGVLEESILHERAFRRPELCTHITDKQVLVRDRTVWNKVYRRDFWERNALAFPAGIYEDVPVAMQAHVLAGSVDMVGDVVYHWRKRDAGRPRSRSAGPSCPTCGTGWPPSARSAPSSTSGRPSCSPASTRWCWRRTSCSCSRRWRAATRRGRCWSWPTRGWPR